MRKFVIALLTAALLTTFTGCGGTVGEHETLAPSKDAQHTILPAAGADPTAEPEETPVLTAEVTADPLVFETGGKDFCCALKPGELKYFDIDKDGKGDAVLFETNLNGDEGAYSLTVTLAGKPETPFHYSTWGYDGRAWVVDSDPNDDRLEIICCDDGPSGDPSGVAIRLRDDGSEFSQFEIGGIRNLNNAGEFDFSSENGFETIYETVLFGTNFPDARIRITSSGIKLLTKGYMYPAERSYVLKRDMKARILNDDGSDGEKYTIPVNTEITPVYSDDYDEDATYIVVRIPDGRLAKVSVESGEEGAGWYIDGVDQYSYADFPMEG